MKTNHFISIISIAFILSFALGASAKSEEYSNTYNTQYDVQKGVQLKINCEFTDIKAYNWDKDVISIEVNVSVDAKNQDQAQKRLQLISVDMDGNPSEVKLRTNLEKNYFGHNHDNNIDIEVIIYYPSYTNIDLENDFGNCLFEDIDGKVSVEMSYGNFSAQDLTQTDLDLEAEFGKIDVNRFQGGKVEVSYGGFTAEVVGAIRLTSEFSSNDINMADHLELNTSYDKDYLGTITTTFVDSEFSNIKIDKLTKHLRLETAYGSFRLNEISPDFELIDISSEFTGIKLAFLPPLSFSFEANVEMGNFKYPKELAHITYIDKEMMELNIKGYFGESKENNSEVILNIENATASINVNE